VQLVSQEPDGTRWTLQAQQGQGWEGQGTGKLEGVRGTLERASGTVQLEAGRAEIEEMDVIRLSEGVVLRWDGYAVRLSSAEYQRRGGRVTSADRVELQGANLSVRGTGLDLDVAQRTARIMSDVDARIARGTP
jgi:LPS export ABC transporter protein LptC